MADHAAFCQSGQDRAAVNACDVFFFKAYINFISVERDFSENLNPNK